ncbi:MAG TPA: hypothetical protein VJ804_15910 [Acidimicrobiales bacterium]|nr:hypothetical protein [Acidimicrobiales bacterium]
MDAWDGWPYARAYLFLVALAFLVVGGQVYLFHLRAAFRARSMYGPVVMAPVIAAAGVAGAITRSGAFGWVVLAVFALAFAEGLFGTVLHLRGVAARVGGFTLRNLTAGPPPLLPLAFGALGLTGALAVAWEAW